MMLEPEEEIVVEESKEAYEDLLENDAISPEEHGFMMGWLEAGEPKVEAEIEIEE